MANKATNKRTSSKRSSSQSNNHLRFVMDPQRLIYQTDGARYAKISGNEVDENATVLFMSMNKAAGKYTNISNYGCSS